MENGLSLTRAGIFIYDLCIFKMSIFRFHKLRVLVILKKKLN